MLLERPPLVKTPPASNERLYKSRAIKIEEEEEDVCVVHCAVIVVVDCVDDGG